MPAAERGRTLYGRRNELTTLTDLLTDATNGRSGVMVIRGEAGIGKTSLIEQIKANANGFRVLSICGAEIEMELPFAAIQQLCSPLTTFLDRIPAPQRDALTVSFGLAEGDPPDQLLVGLAVLSLLGAASAEQQLLCTIDDAQWIDGTSLRILSFVARRLLAEPIAIIFAARDAGAAEELRGHHEMTLSGLPTADAEALLASVLPDPVDAHVKRNILAEARGNPLVLTELHNALSPGEFAGGYGLTRAANPKTLEQGFEIRLRELPRASMRLLLIAAAEPAGRSDWLWAAATSLGIEHTAVDPAATAGLVELTAEGVHFRHPLIRTALYRNASLSDRREVHSALAEVIVGPSSDDYRAWHRAHAVSGTDDDVAEDLERSARRARSRGGAAAAAAFLARAADLTSQPERRARRSIDAAEAKLDSGSPRAALPLLDMAEGTTDDEFLTARIELVRAKVAFAAHRGTDAPSLLLSAARRLAAHDPALARETHLQAITAAILVGRCATGPHDTASAIAEAAADAPPAPGKPRAVDLLLDGLVVRLTRGHRAAAPALRAALAAYLDEVASDTADPRWHDITHRVCLDVFDIDAYNDLAERQLAQLRAAGALTILPLALQTSAGVSVTSGNLADAAMKLDESALILSATGTPLPNCLWAFVAAYRGHDERCLDIVSTTINRARERGEGFDINGALFSEAILHNGRGRYREAFDAASSALEHPDLGMHTNVLTELIEAAVRCDETAVAERAVADVIAETEVCDTPQAQGISARARALISDGPMADESYREGIECFRHTPNVILLMRTHLVYGEWLRRRKQRARARMHLRIAYDAFTEMGAEGFAQRAGRELRATGEPVLSARANVTTGLTRQEAQIATLARDGYTNAEIAGQLFISPRTVEWHLGRIFNKLHVTSRRQLRSMVFDLG